ncbi:mesoderm induction early response protein 2 isoform X2 [Polypterus senegalus]|nr:mesoderm induction early response protein 2 isoform X2 [Polypterus senegalus]
MPLEELLALYGYEVSDPIPEHNNEDTVLPHSLPDMTLDKEQIAKDLLSGEEEEETQSSADDLTPSVTSHDASDLFTHPLRSNSIADDDKETSSNSSEDDSEDDSIFSSDGRKDIMVGPQYQALIPPLNRHRYQERACENEDQLLWDPHVLPEKEVEQFLLRVEKRGREEANWEMLPDGALVRDNEQGLYELVKCSFNVEEALRRLRFNVKVIRDELCAWSEEECRNFEHGYRVHGKNFHLIQANKVRTRSVGECVEYYYMWKKSDRHDYFTQQSKFGRRKYSLPPGAMDYVDQDIDSGDVDSASHAQSSPALQSTTSAQDSQFDQDALDLEGTDVESRESLSFSIGNNVDASNPEFNFGQISPSASGGSCLYSGSVPSFHLEGSLPLAAIAGVMGQRFTCQEMVFMSCSWTPF